MEQLGVNSAAAHQLLVRAALGNLTFLEHHYLIRVAHR